ncbi:MAG: hypothetical protein ACYS9X_17730 [Planctomycetota bacterium]
MDNVEAIRTKFEAIGARFGVRVADPATWRSRRVRGSFTIDVRSDRRGEFFDLVMLRGSVRFHVGDARPAERHLLLVKHGGRNGLQKFLCGHDERHWFVAGVPRHAANVVDAMEALKPEEAVRSQRRRRVKAKDRNRRKNAAFIRQGEWFFIPVPGFKPKDGFVLRNEPIQRGRSRPHVVEELHRSGGTTVYVSDDYPAGLTPERYKALLKQRPEKRRLRWQVMSREPEAYGRGRVRHPDHKTVVLSVWHRIVPNREVTSGSNVFLD